MNKDFYVIYYESAHWAGYGSHCVVWASSDFEACAIAENHMEEEMLELYGSEYDDERRENDDWCQADDDAAHEVIKCEVLTESDNLEFFLDKQQRDNFYPIVNAYEANHDITEQLIKEENRLAGNPLNSVAAGQYKILKQYLSWLE